MLTNSLTKFSFAVFVCVILAEAGINVLGQHLQTTPRVGYVVFDIEGRGSRELLRELKSVDGTIRARILY